MRLIPSLYFLLSICGHFNQNKERSYLLKLDLKGLLSRCEKEKGFPLSLLYHSFSL